MKLHLRKEKALELSKAEESPQTAKKKKIDALLNQISNNIIADSKGNR
jgi:hypothetical protein